MPWEAPTICELGEWVDLQSRSQEAAASGALTDTFTTEVRTRARVRQIFGGRYIDGAQTGNAATHNFEVRWRSDWRTWRFVVWEGYRYRVLQALQHGRHEWVQYVCEEIGEI